MIAHDLLLHVLEKEPLGLINAGFSMTFAFCVIQSTVLKHWHHPFLVHRVAGRMGVVMMLVVPAV